MFTHCAHARFVYNLGLEQRSMWTPARRHFQQRITLATQMRELAAARSEVDWLRAGSSVVQQGALRDLDRAFANFFAGRAAYPTWRKASHTQGFIVRDLTTRRVTRRHAEVTVPKVGRVRFRLTRPWEQVRQCTSARVTLDRAGRWHVSLTCPAPVMDRARTGRATGVDRGVANTLALPDGTMLRAPDLTPGERARFLALARRLSRQRKGSNRRARTRDSLARLHARLADRRTDWIEQTTTTLVRGHDLIAIEALNTRGMTRRPAPRPDPDLPGAYLPNGARAKAALNRAILASCWGRFETRLTDKAAHTPPGARTTIARVPAAHTSRTCHECGHTDRGNRESQAVFTCQRCGHTAHADTNAARNILAAAITNPRTSGDRAHQPHGHVGRANQPPAA